ncbi:ATP-binding protein [Burkholderia sp. MSMB0856]|uniref:AAA family ATPase n=1 Tax=Burkholderia sp. MSMB0856 TaxID=1637869 RepID=UPI00075207DE|nr:AAA family ATPase [Burkholderia sp. MSMB0856]AOJ90467.1 ATP-binding protein [Burkholderia sp. MSMB0856]KVH35000.1 ATP-binding protein [Burkholderia sp. MSMB0856]
MNVEKLELRNVGQFRSLTVALAPLPAVPSNVTILIGNNGTGKTTILKSLATVLSWLVARVRSDNGNGTPIPEEVIRNDAVSAALEITLTEQSDRFGWTLAKARLGRKGEHASNFDDANQLADRYRHAFSIDASTSLPLIAFYSVERVVLDVPLKIREKHTFSQLDGYDNSLKQGVDFRRFFEWFREREDWENESGISKAADNLERNDPEKLKALIDFIENGGADLDNLKKFDFKGLRTVLQQATNALQIARTLREGVRDPQLDAVRRAIGEFMPGFRNLKVRRKPRLHMSVDKQGQRLNILQLSQGEKSLMALVGDIARRLAMMNPGLEDPLHGNGIVLIDEVDLHLHPQWARKIVERLRTTFPNCQFVLTTHSPLVISDCRDVLLYALNDGELTQVPSQYGQDANTVLLDVMDTHIRNSTIAKRLNDLMDFIQESKLEEAKGLLNELKLELPPNNLELTKASLLLRKKEQRAKD